MEKSIRVLMVDDEEQFRSTTKKILARRGFQMILAGSGAEALEKMAERPDVVVLDIKMPGMDGHETLREIKKRAPDIPVIMLTGHGDPASAKEALEHGATDYLAKPCDIDLLSSKIHNARRKQRYGGEPGAEKKIVDIMIPISDYTRLTPDHTVREALQELRTSFSCKQTTSSIMETGHRSILVLDDAGKTVVGVLSIQNLMEAVLPKYLRAPKPSMADSLVYSPMFWCGMFTTAVGELAEKKISDLMGPVPFSIDVGANLMEAAYEMVQNSARRLIVMSETKPVGVLREQEMFFEMERIVNGSDR
jgi:DNA-binding response OmpR family regulator